MEKKWTLFTFSRSDFKSVEEYLNEQAHEGWELERAGILARWKRTERHDLTYCVDLANPRQERDEQADYAAFCTEAGWELTALTGQMYIFKSLPGVEAIPIQTDPELEKSNYKRYYLRKTILSVLFLALYLGIWIFMGAAMGRYTTSAVTELRYELMNRWLLAGLIVSLPIWAVWAVWKIADFIRAAIQSRNGEIGRSPRWVMWVNCILGLLAGAGGVLFLLGDALEILFIADMNSYVLILAALWGIVCFFRALTIENEMFKRERRRYVVTGVVLFALFALLIAGRVAAPYGQWNTNPYSADEEAAEKYVLLENVPIVRGEDIGVPLNPENTEHFYLTYELTPMGEHWKLENHYAGGGLNLTGCETYGTPTVSAAKRLVKELVHKATVFAYVRTFSDDTGVEMQEMELNWADDAWYGELRFMGRTVSVLVVRTDKQVTYLCAPVSLVEQNLLSAVEKRLSA